MSVSPKRSRSTGVERAMRQTRCTRSLRSWHARRQSMTGSSRIVASMVLLCMLRRARQTRCAAGWHSMGMSRCSHFLPWRPWSLPWGETPHRCRQCQARRILARLPGARHCRPSADR
eukprot:5955187-Prymnesium_polylepis.1